jgi:hypothetical protein
MEWHTTAHSEPAHFWADASDSRDPETLKVRWAKNEFACGYGRSSNDRSCDQIRSTYVIMWTSSGLAFDLVSMDENNMIAGDSGGGWSYVNEVIGVHRGTYDLGFLTSAHDCFSKAENIDNALDVEVTLCPVYLDCD